MLEIKEVTQIKHLCIIALYSDDYLMDKLVLKGGNALDLVYKISPRASIDIDFSIESDFTKEELIVIESKIKKQLIETFNAENYEVFDILFTKQPKIVSVELETFWGGYNIEFKIIEKPKYNKHNKNLDDLRRNAIVVGENQKKTFNIDISKFEYCTLKKASEFDGFTIYVYTPEMIVCEKIRAICQQMPEYTEIVKKNRNAVARARDFFDIYTVCQNFDIDLSTTDNLDLIKNIFSAKKVPLQLIKEIYKYKNFHRIDFVAVRDTIRPGNEQKEFNFYFDFVIALCEKLKSLWKE